jgi:DNA-binding CsgD family transcriptional regulator
LFHRQAVRNAARRLSPSFLIFDSELAIVMRSPELDMEGMLEPLFVERVVQALRRTAPERADGGLTFEAIDDETILRMVPLAGKRSGSTAVFIERIEDRRSVTLAAVEYRLTPRETEVLDLLVRSRTSAEIADRLSISETTVGDHVKSVMRKVNCSRRSELIARVYKLDHDASQIDRS